MIAIAGNLIGDTPQHTKAGARHVLNVPVVRDLSADPRLLAIARQFVGAAAVPFRATLFDKSPTAKMSSCERRWVERLNRCDVSLADEVFAADCTRR